MDACIPIDAIPVWFADQAQEEDPTAMKQNDFFISPTEFPAGRLGLVAIFAPSGVAAGNSNGMTFHNGLRSHRISRFEICKDPSPEVLSKLTANFARVVCIVVDEYSMKSLTQLAYLHKILRLVRPGASHVRLRGSLSLLLETDYSSQP